MYQKLNFRNIPIISSIQCQICHDAFGVIHITTISLFFPLLLRSISTKLWWNFTYSRNNAKITLHWHRCYTTVIYPLYPHRNTCSTNTMYTIHPMHCIWFIYPWHFELPLCNFVQFSGHSIWHITFWPQCVDIGFNRIVLILGFSVPFQQCFGGTYFHIGHCVTMN